MILLGREPVRRQRLPKAIPITLLIGSTLFRCYVNFIENINKSEIMLAIPMGVRTMYQYTWASKCQ